MSHSNWEQRWKAFAVVAFSKLFLQHFFSCVPWVHTFYKRPLRHTVSTRPNSYYAFQAAGMLIFIRVAFLYWCEEPTLGWQASYIQSRKLARYRNQTAIMEFMKFIPELVYMNLCHKRFNVFLYFLPMMLGIYGKYTSDLRPQKEFLPRCIISIMISKQPAQESGDLSEWGQGSFLCWYRGGISQPCQRSWWSWQWCCGEDDVGGDNDGVKICIKERAEYNIQTWCQAE